MAAAEGEMAQADSAGFEVTEGYRRYVLGLLFFVYVVNFVDRQIMTILLQPIKAEFGFSDTQMGILTGLAFALLYATLGIPIARYADSNSRVKVISVALFVWSLFTAVTGMAKTFSHFLLADKDTAKDAHRIGRPRNPSAYFSVGAPAFAMFVLNLVPYVAMRFIAET